MLYEDYCLLDFGEAQLCRYILSVNILRRTDMKLVVHDQTE